MIRDYILLGATLIVAATILLIFPDRLDIVTTTSWAYFFEMMLILPMVMMVMGLFTVWVSKETVVKYMGKSSGIKGIFFAILFGALPTGPLYVTFPMASSLIKKRCLHFQYRYFPFGMGMHKDPSKDGGTPIHWAKIYGIETCFDDYLCNYHGSVHRMDYWVE